MNRSLILLLMFIAGIAVVVLLFRNPVVPSHVSPPVNQPVVAVTPSNALPPVPVMQPPAVVSNVVAPPPPPFVPPAVVTPALSNLVDRRLDYVERVRTLTSGRLTEVKDPQDLATLATVLADPQEDEVVRHEIVNLLNRSGDPALEARLWQILDNPAEGEKFRAWAVQHLGGLLTTPGRIPVSSDLLPRVRQLLADRDLHVRREALLALSRANDSQTLVEIPGMLTNQAPGADGMRDLAMARPGLWGDFSLTDSCAERASGCGAAYFMHLLVQFAWRNPARVSPTVRRGCQQPRLGALKALPARLLATPERRHLTFGEVKIPPTNPEAPWPFASPKPITYATRFLGSAPISPPPTTPCVLPRSTPSADGRIGRAGRPSKPP